MNAPLIHHSFLWHITPFHTVLLFSTDPLGQGSVSESLTGVYRFFLEYSLQQFIIYIKKLVICGISSVWLKSKITSNCTSKVLARLAGTARKSLFLFQYNTSRFSRPQSNIKLNVIHQNIGLAKVI